MRFPIKNTVLPKTWWVYDDDLIYQMYDNQKVEFVFWLAKSLKLCEFRLTIAEES